MRTIFVEAAMNRLVGVLGALILGVILIFLVVGIVGKKRVNDCVEVHEKLERVGTEKLVTWFDENYENWDLGTGHAIKYPFGRGGASVDLGVDPETLGLLDDAEAQVVRDSKGRLVMIQILDSENRSIVVVKQSGRWFAWGPEQVMPLGERVAVICHPRD
ncbi:hypothetical protein QFW77_18320 [Luteimonas sp. RD2P54]|uniref:Uncharacterized protein n=1 Tax=Luteimonas endophytica TaxID=3042023 RepID=A0ABT6JDM6_9GAMM|nr:hypothetical protein [Luteimonas endophytica]MDH5824925.1 hypothetical protein [Luteimonas endophytica]